MHKKCFNKLKKKLADQFGPGEFEGEVVSFDKSTSSFPPARYKYHPKKTDGTPSKKFQHVSVFPTFCGVCGKRL